MLQIEFKQDEKPEWQTLLFQMRWAGKAFWGGDTDQRPESSGEPAAMPISAGPIIQAEDTASANTLL